MSLILFNITNYYLLQNHSSNNNRLLLFMSKASFYLNVDRIFFCCYSTRQFLRVVESYNFFIVVVM